MYGKVVSERVKLVFTLATNSFVQSVSQSVCHLFIACIPMPVQYSFIRFLRCGVIFLFGLRQFGKKFNVSRLILALAYRVGLRQGFPANTCIHVLMFNICNLWQEDIP